MEGRPPLEFLVSKLPELLEHFGLQGEFRWKELDSFDDRNLMVTFEDGRKYVVKAHNTLLPSGSLERLDAQDRLMCQLHSQGLPVPEVLYRDGCSTYTLPSPVPALVRILTYLEGDLIKNEAPKSPALLRRIGALCGSVAVALESFDAKGFQWTWAWDMKRLPEVVRSKLPFISADRRPLAERLCHAYAERLCTERPEHGGRLCDVLPHTVLHADLNDTNLLFADDEVVGVIDFGDSIHSCRIFEPGITAGRADGGDGCTARLFVRLLRKEMGRCKDINWYVGC
ncbi:Hydroxylysine kinase (5-hydroxy-L-lysine kinase) (Aminoglycoside phosphotransferase domain-containing protein 1) [Durusdinium trenchii]|uniref:Hydroxylysine kinase n=1 Tax=Durusdinium trenchii TaxID=1381693 RepID=A0ABP0QG96_9DINO